MSKKSSKKRQPQVEPKKQETVTFGYEEMLTELEAIVADAELRLEDEEAAGTGGLDLCRVAPTAYPAYRLMCLTGHDLNNLLVGFLHRTTCQRAQVSDRLLHVMRHNPFVSGYSSIIQRHQYRFPRRGSTG